MHPAATTGQGKNGDIYTSEPARAPHPNRQVIISALINSKKPIAWKKTQCISLFQAIHQDCNADEVNTVAERVHLICWVLKDITNRKLASLQTLMDRIGHNDPLHDLHHNSYVAVAELFFLSRNIWVIALYLISSRAHVGPVVDETTNIAVLCYPFHLAQAGQSEDFQLCVVLKPSNETGCSM